MKRSLEVKDEAIEVAIAKANSLEERNREYNIKLVKCSKTIKKLMENGDNKADHKECKRAIAEKDKIIKKAETDKKTLAKRIEEIENSIVAENTGLSEQQKSTNEKLKSKSKELKDASNELKKVIANEKTLQEALMIKNRKIAELEAAVLVLQVTFSKKGK